MSTQTNRMGSEQEPPDKDKPDKDKSGQDPQDQEVYQLRLYIMGMSRQSMQALTNLKQVCEKYLADCYELEVIDLQRQSEPIAEDGFIAAPMLVKNFPLPVRKFIGNLANTQELLRRLDIADDAMST
jgi:circadian clock protein KaiB